MFSIPRVNVIESDEGFSVEVLGRTGLKYTSRYRVLFVDSEVLMGPPDLMVLSGRIRGWEDSAPVTEAERVQVIDNSGRAFRHRGRSRAAHCWVTRHHCSNTVQ